MMAGITLTLLTRRMDLPAITPMAPVCSIQSNTNGTVVRMFDL